MQVLINFSFFFSLVGFALFLILAGWEVFPTSPNSLAVNIPPLLIPQNNKPPNFMFVT
jgi:hypothetical protein